MHESRSFLAKGDRVIQTGQPDAFAALLDRRPVLLDGAYGSFIMELGLEPGRPPDEWNLTRPDDVAGLHRRYLEAGSRIIITNTFGSNAVKLARSGLADRARDINRRGAGIAREVAGGRALVAGDIGPTGELLEPFGGLSSDDARAGFREQAEALAEGGADLIIVETMYHLLEALIALEAALEATSLPVIVSMTFEKRGERFATVMGDFVAVALRELASRGASAAGANCSIESGEMVELADGMLAAASVPVIAQPNAGKPELVDGAVKYAATPDRFARDILSMTERGVALVGGCCGTTPEFIRTIRERLDEAERDRPA